MMLENVSGGGKETLKITVKASELRGGGGASWQFKEKSKLSSPWDTEQTGCTNRTNWLEWSHR
jgi:hypothetical protein